METVEYEYAGFRYAISDVGGKLKATPLPGQHASASKDRHVRAAVSCYAADKGIKGYGK